MNTEYLAIAVTVMLVVVTSAPLGRYIARIFTDQRTALDPMLAPIERSVLRIIGTTPEQEQNSQQYSRSLLVSNLIMWLATLVRTPPIRSRTRRRFRV